MRYYRQGYEIGVEVTPEQLRESGVAGLEQRFHALHAQLYGFGLQGSAACEVVNLRAVALGRVPEPALEPAPLEGPDPRAAATHEQQAYFDGGWHPTVVYERSLLAPGNRIAGPAIVAEFDSTTVLLPGFAAEVDAFHNLIIRPEA
jgi:N-methylhydantoinase A